MKIFGRAFLNKLFIFLLLLFVTTFFFLNNPNEAKAAYTPLDYNCTYNIDRYKSGNIKTPPGGGAQYYPRTEYLNIKDSLCATNSGVDVNFSAYTNGSKNEFYIIDTGVTSLYDRIVYITSPLDFGGCLTVCGNIEEYTEVKFANRKDSLSNKQEFIISYVCDAFDGSPCFEILLEENRNYKLGFDDVSKKICLLKSNSQKTYFRFSKIGSIDTHLSTGPDYAYRNSDLDRIGNALSDGSGRISKMITLNINGEKRLYNGINAYTINPTETINNQIQLTLHFSHEYKQERIDWCKIDGNVYYLDNDSYLGFGSIIIESAESLNGEFKTETKVIPVSDSYYNTITLSNDYLIGTYIRVSFIYKLSDGNNELFVRETSDVFYISYGGFGTDDNGIIQITDLNPKINENEYSGFDINMTKKGTTLKDGAFVLNGFEVKKVIPGYTITVSNGALNVNVDDSQSFNEKGTYFITIKSIYDEKYTLSINNLGIKNINQDIETELIKAYFGKTYQDSLDTGTSFIEGERVLGGISEGIDNSIQLPYSWVKIPIFYKNVTYHINQTTYPKLTGTITRVVNDKEEITEINSNIDDETSGIISGEGVYTIELKTTNDTGYVATFIFNFVIVDEEPKPIVNESLIYKKSQEIYDLAPIYYGVTVEEGSYKYYENEKLVEKSGILIYAFSNYDDALSFALRVEKRYATKQDSGNFIYTRYNEHIEIDEFDLFTMMYENAKNNVKQSYFSAADKNIYKSISVGEAGEAYQISFSSTNNVMIVCSSLEEREKLTVREPFINNYKFVNVNIDSNEVKLINLETQEEYEIAYDENMTVGEQLEEKLAPTGKYKVVEKTLHNRINEYNVNYIAIGDSTIKAKLTISNESLDIDRNSSGKKYETNSSFVINNISNEFDSHSLLLVVKDNNYYAYDISKINELEFKEKGIYKISFVDRIGNTYSISIEII